MKPYENNSAEIINKTTDRHISVLSYMELLHGAKNKRHHILIRNFLKDQKFNSIELNSSISHRASIYMEEYAISHGLKIVDSLIASTAVENNMTLCTANYKHFRFIAELNIKKMTV